jgi:hypothetical protein
MMTRDAKTTFLGVLVISVWHEPGVPDALRARLTFGRGDDEAPTVSYVDDPTDVVSAVQRWLIEIGS